MYQSAKQIKRFKSRISAKHTKLGTSVSKTSHLRLLRPKPKYSGKSCLQLSFCRQQRVKTALQQSTDDRKVSTGDVMDSKPIKTSQKTF